MSDYVSKPIDPKILDKVVQKWLSRKEHEPQTASPSESAGDYNPQIPDSSGVMVFDLEKFLQRMMGDEEFAHEVVAGFVSELPELLRSLNQSVATADLESIWKQAHKIKGSAANVGGEALKDAALKVEQAGKASNVAEAILWASKLEIQAARLIELLEQWQAIRSPGNGSTIESDC
jgi:HPt (histidine-containing phosphotransfer) domain-containing protein